MPWETILGYAAGITSAVSLAAFVAALYIWFQSRARETSVVETVRGQGIVNAELVVPLLKTFDTDEKRLEALREITGYDQKRAEGLLEKVKSNVDLEKFSSARQVNLQKRLNWTALFLLLLAVLCVGISKLPNLQANDDDQVSDNTPGGKARAEANLGWDYEVGYQRPVNYKKAMELYQKAAADGDATANWNIARMYEFGFGVPKDFDKARYWYDKATAAGEPRGQLYKDNIGKNQPYVDTK